VVLAIINKKAARRLEGGHPWVFKSDILSLPDQDAGVVEVSDEKKRFLGQALFSPRSTITLRLIRRDRGPIDRPFLKERVAQALARRQRALVGADAFRLIHGEADLLPGIFADRYADATVLQTTCAGAAALESLLIETLVELLSPRILVVRNDASSRRHEGLSQESRIAHGAPPATALFHEGDVALEVDLLADQKTGAFLDQSANHLAAGRYARGEALDCFTYHGGFALQLARGCHRVVAVDQSKQALERGRKNAERAGIRNIEWTAANVLDLLPKLVAAEHRFDTIVVDPPAFASTAKTIEAAGRAYKEVNLRAMQLLKPNGILVTCSCSGRITVDDFDGIIRSAAADARRSLQILERRGAGPDHPVLAGVPETEYLKCRICAVL
jgi:23S rRNA (cytosine1962-C5)-methyltransferase